MSHGPPGPRDSSPGNPGSPGGGNGETPNQKLNKAKSRLARVINKGHRPGSKEYENARAAYIKAQREAYGE